MLRRIREWWSVRRWWFRHGIGAMVLLVCFYAFEDFRAWRAWHQHHDAEHFSPEGALWLKDIPHSADALEQQSRTFGQISFAEAYRLSPIDSEWSGFSSCPELGFFSPSALESIDETGNVSAHALQWRSCFSDIVSVESWSGISGARRTLEVLRPYERFLKEFSEVARVSAPDSIAQSEFDPKNLQSGGGWPGCYSEDPIRDCAHALAVRAHAHLSLDQSDRALEDLLSILRFSWHLSRKGSSDTETALSLLIPARQVIWHGLGSEAWDESQLSLLAIELERIEPARWWQLYIWTSRETYRPFFRYIESGPIQRFRANSHFMTEVFELPPSEWISNRSANFRETYQMTGSVVFALMPNGWLRQNWLNYCRECDLALQLFDTDDPNTRSSILAVAMPFHPTVRKGPYEWWMGPHFFPERGWERRVFVSEVYARQLKLAVALELHRARLEGYPSSLEMAARQVPKRVAIDPFSGGTFIYRLNENGRPFLSSYGPDGIDDGGKTASDIRSGDLVWHYGAHPW